LTRGVDLPAGRPHIVGLGSVLLRHLGLNETEDPDSTVWGEEAQWAGA